MSNCTICQGFGFDEDFNKCSAGCESNIAPRRGARGAVMPTEAPARGNGCGKGHGKAVKIATVKQVAFLTKLIEERDQANEAVAAALAACNYGMAMRDASTWIDALLALPASAPQVAAGASVRSNRYPGHCGTCGAPVAADSGRIERNAAGKWITHHLANECPVIEAPADGINLAPLERFTSANVARFAVPGGDTRLKLRLAFKNGTVWVTDAAVYGERTTYGSQRPGAAYRGKCEDALRSILADPIAALAAYGALTSECGVCGRPLEDAESVARGIGPVCAAKVAG